MSNEQQGEALLPQTTYKNKRVATDDERFRLNSELNTYLFNNCDHPHDGYPNHLACRRCVLDCLAAISSRASFAAEEGDALKKLSSRIGDIINESLRSYRCQHTRELPDLENGLSLVDLLTPEPDKDVTRGVEECDLLADYVWSDVDDAIKAFTAAASSQLPAEPPQPADDGFPCHCRCHNPLVAQRQTCVHCNSYDAYPPVALVAPNDKVPKLLTTEEWKSLSPESCHRINDYFATTPPETPVVAREIAKDVVNEILNVPRFIRNPESTIIEIENKVAAIITRYLAATPLPETPVEDEESRRISASLALIEQRFAKATTHDEVAALVWACRALIDTDAKEAPFFMPEFHDRNVVYATGLRLYFEHAQRALGRSPYPAELDQVEAGFCAPHLEALKPERMERGRQLLCEILSAAPVVSDGDDEGEGLFSGEADELEELLDDAKSNPVFRARIMKAVRAAVVDNEEPHPGYDCGGTCVIHAAALRTNVEGEK